MFKKLKIKQGLFTLRLICRASVLSALCSFPVTGTAQSQPEGLSVQIRVLLEGLLIDNSVIAAALGTAVSNEMIVVSTDTVITHEMIIVPSGTFTMGSPADEPSRWMDEGPQHQVNIRSFAVGKHEVTRGQFAAFVDATEYDAGNCWRNPGFTQTDTHPVVCVSWNDAKAYINWLLAKSGRQYRLLTEAEWEYVARAGTTTAYHFGATISPSQANYNNTETVVVGSYPANAFGLHDVHGNVWEWVEDCWHNNYNGAPSDGSAWTSNCYDENDVRVLRGGAHRGGPSDLRSAIRLWKNVRSRFSDRGFRIARTLSP